MDDGNHEPMQDDSDFHHQSSLEQQEKLEHLKDLYWLGELTGKQEQVFSIAERVGLLNEFKQFIADQAEGGIHGTYIEEAGRKRI